MLVSSRPVAVQPGVSRSVRSLASVSIKPNVPDNALPELTFSSSLKSLRNRMMAGIAAAGLSIGGGAFYLSQSAPNTDTEAREVQAVTLLPISMMGGNTSVFEVQSRTRDALEAKLKLEFTWESDWLNPAHSKFDMTKTMYQSAVQKMASRFTAEEIKADPSRFQAEVEKALKDDFQSYWVEPYLKAHLNDLMSYFTYQDLRNDRKPLVDAILHGYRDPNSGRSIPSLEEVLKAQGIQIKKFESISMSIPIGGDAHMEMIFPVGGDGK